MQESRPTVYLFTETYPFPCPDDPFLPAEVRVLARSFDVCLIPALRMPGPIADLPSGVIYDAGLADYAATALARCKGLVCALLSPRLYSEFWRQRPLSYKPRATVTVLVRLARAISVSQWIRRELAGLSGEKSAIVYAWWSAAFAVGIAFALESLPTPFVSRAHGYDLYAEQERVGFVPFQAALIARADRVFSTSQAGTEYLRGLHPAQASKIATAYLGIEGQAERSRSSTDGVLRVVSCSSVVAVKRVALIADALIELNALVPDLRFHWTHLGGGPLLDALRQHMAESAGMTGRYAFTGPLKPGEVQQWLLGNEIDAFVNVSASEGLPVTLMEAARAGIPIIATAVGGNPEIINQTCGFLLTANPPPAEIAAAILGFARLTPERRNTLRDGSRAGWEGRFRAEDNYAAMASSLNEALRTTV